MMVLIQQLMAKRLDNWKILIAEMHDYNQFMKSAKVVQTIS
jgi:hypothetical protein